MNQMPTSLSPAFASEEAITLVGMEGVFVIIHPDGTSLNMLLEPGRLTSSIVDD